MIRVTRTTPLYICFCTHSAKLRECLLCVKSRYWLRGLASSKVMCYEILPFFSFFSYKCGLCDGRPTGASKTFATLWLFTSTLSSAYQPSTLLVGIAVPNSDLQLLGVLGLLLRSGFFQRRYIAVPTTLMYWVHLRPWIALKCIIICCVPPPWR
jgi:hypothetical protein